MTGKIEILAAFIHHIWAHWMSHLFAQCELRVDGSVTIPKEFVERWERQRKASYQKLSEQERHSDRMFANQLIKIIDDLD